MKRFYYLLSLFLVFVGTATADTTLPTLTTAGDTTFYAIQNMRKSTYVTWTGDNTLMKQSSSLSQMGQIWYFVASDTENTDTSKAVVKLHNYATNNVYASHGNGTASFTADGVDVWIIPHTNSYEGFVITKDGSVSGWNAMNDLNGASITTWSGDDSGSIFSFEEIEPAKVKSIVATEASTYAGLSSDFVGTPTDANITTALSEAYSEYAAAGDAATDSLVRPWPTR